MFKKLFAVCLLLLSVNVASLDAKANKQEKAFQAQLKAYGSAIRWNDFELASEFVDPQTSKGEAFSEQKEAYYKRFQISGYLLKSAVRVDEFNYTQRVEIRIIDVASQTERTKTDRQIWRFDAANKRWWLVSGLPMLD